FTTSGYVTAEGDVILRHAPEGAAGPWLAEALALLAGHEVILTVTDFSRARPAWLAQAARQLEGGAPRRVVVDAVPALGGGRGWGGAGVGGTGRRRAGRGRAGPPRRVCAARGGGPPLRGLPARGRPPLASAGRRAELCAADGRTGAGLVPRWWPKSTGRPDGR